MAIDKAYANSEFRGQIHVPAPPTPFAENGDLMGDAFAEVLEYYVSTVKVDGLLIAGSNGEGYAMTTDELRRVTEIAVRTIAGRIPYYVNVTRTSAKASIARAEVAAEAGATGICLMGHPVILDATEDEIVTRFEKVGKAVPLPMMVYNSSHLQQFNIAPEVLTRIADVAPVACLKDGNRDPDHIRGMMAAHGDRFPVLSGHRETLIPSILLGCGGFVSTGPELFGATVREVFEVHDMTPTERFALHCKYIEVTDAALYDSVPPAGIKGALNLIGLPAGVPRDPVLPLTPAQEANLRAVLVKYGILEGEVKAAQ